MQRLLPFDIKLGEHLVMWDLHCASEQLKRGMALLFIDATKIPRACFSKGSKFKSRHVRG